MRTRRFASGPPTKSTAARRYLAKLWESGKPVVLSINGKLKVPVHDQRLFEEVFALVDRLETVAAVKRGLAEKAAGLGRPATEVSAALRKEVGAKRRKV